MEFSWGVGGGSSQTERPESGIPRPDVRAATDFRSDLGRILRESRFGLDSAPGKPHGGDPVHSKGTPFVSGGPLILP